jgi:sugar porter (SP) family MFS transporter
LQWAQIVPAVISTTLKTALPTEKIDRPSAVCGHRVVAAIVCSIAGTTFGYDLGALSGTTQGILQSYSLTPTVFGFTMSASLWGAMCASLFAGKIADEIGRRGLLALCSIIYALSALVIAFPQHWPWAILMSLRFLSGLTIGGLVVACPLYLAEIAPRTYRGRIVGLFQLQTGAGVLAAFGVSAFLARGMTEAAEWKWCFGLGAIPPAVMLLLLKWMPEEPHWLALHNHRQKATAAAAWLGFSQEEWPAGFDNRTVPLSSPAPSERLFRKIYLRALLLATSAALFNQLCGVTVIRVYLLDMLAHTSMGRSLSHSYGISLSLFNVAALLLGMAVVDKIGRRPLLIAGSAGMAISLFALAAALRWHAMPMLDLIILFAFNTCFACSQGAVTWVLISEIFPFPVRGKGQSYGATVHWIANAGLIWLYPVMEQAVPQSSFTFFGLLMVLQIILVWNWYPETRGTDLGQDLITNDFGRRPD